MFMKRLILSVVVLSPLFFFAGCNPSKNPEVNASSASPATSAATIAASPNPVPAGEGLGTTTITWNTGDGKEGQVFVSTDGGAEASFGGAPSGSAAAPWIQTGKTYEFRLYAGTEHATVLTKTVVTRSK